MGGDFSVADLPQGGKICLHRCNFSAHSNQPSTPRVLLGHLPAPLPACGRVCPICTCPPTSMLSNCHHFPALDPTWEHRATSLAILTRLENTQVYRNSPKTSHRNAAGAEKKWP